jgi:hypothetical protein
MFKTADTDSISIKTLLDSTPCVTDKNASPMLKLAVFGDAPTPRGSYRNNANVLSITGVEIDYDAGIMSPEVALDLLKVFKVKGVITTTFSHTEDRPRWRCFALCSQEYAPDRRLEFAEQLNTVFQGKGAVESGVLSQAYYIGGNSARPELYKTYENLEGKFIDECTDIKRTKFGLSDEAKAIKLAKQQAKRTVDDATVGRHNEIHKLGIYIGKLGLDEAVLNIALDEFAKHMRQTNTSGERVELNYPLEQKNISDGYVKGLQDQVVQTDRHAIHYQAGMLAQHCDQVLGLMRDYYYRGEGLSHELVKVEGGFIETRSVDLLLDDINKIVSFYTESETGRKYMNCPASIAKTILARKVEHLQKFKELKGLITAPLIRLDGSFITDTGYDEVSALYLHNSQQEDFSVNLHPTERDVAEAFRTIMYPFESFPFETPLDKSVFIAAILTAVCRKSLPTAPGFIFEASTPGSGKSLLQDCLSVICSGVKPASIGLPERDDEMRKTLFSTLRTGASVISLDNIVGKLESQALCGFLTSSHIEDRVLGVSETLKLPNKCLLLGSGNNLQLMGDLCRRIFKITLNPNMENPFLREFSLNPLEWVTANRLVIIKAALTLLAGFRQASGFTKAPGNFASFEDWDRLIRQAVVWLGLPDPLDKITTQFQQEPVKQRLHALMETWYGFLCSEPYSLKNLISPSATGVKQATYQVPTQAQTQARELYMEALTEVCADPRKDGLNSRILGAFLQAQKNRVVGGYAIRAVFNAHSKAWEYYVEKIA